MLSEAQNTFQVTAAGTLFPGFAWGKGKIRYPGASFKQLDMRFRDKSKGLLRSVCMAIRASQATLLDFRLNHGQLLNEKPGDLVCFGPHVDMVKVHLAKMESPPAILART